MNLKPQINNNAVYSESDYHTQRHAVSDEAFDLIARYRADKFSQFVRSGASILEFGCGPGWNLIDFPALRRVGYDVTLEFADRLRSKGVEFTSDLDSLSGQEFDFILISHVLEHLVEPARTISELRPLLKAGGTLVLVVPFDRPGRTYDPSHNNHHLYMWDVQSLTELLKACGYTVKSCSVGHYGFDRLAATLATRCGLGYRAYRLLLSIMRTLRPGREIVATLMK